MMVSLMTAMMPEAMAQQNDGSAPAVIKPAADGKASGDGMTLEDMMSTIKRLEERIKELEEKQSRADKSERAEAVTAALAINPPKARDDKQEEEKKANNGILSFFRSTELMGLVDGYYSYNFNQPRADAQLRNFDTRHNQFALNLLEIALERKPTPDSRLGFRADLDFGPATEIVHSFEPGGSDIFRHLQQGYLSYLAPAGNGVQIDFGKFVTQHGAEVIETKDNWNYSRSLMFALAIPYYHFGVRASYPFNDKFTLAGFLVNGWNNVVDNNTGKTIGVQAVIKPSSKLTLIQNYMTGPEQSDNNDDFRHLFDTTAIYTANDRVSLMANYDYGWDTVAGTRVHWQGVAAYARFQANKWFAFAPRFEWYDDHDGFTTGARQTVKGVTFTSEQKINGGLLTRFEYRRDFSDTDFFSKRTGRLVEAQSTLSFGLVYAFSSKGDQ
jgi:hypothetical protein